MSYLQNALSENDSLLPMVTTSAAHPATTTREAPYLRDLSADLARAKLRDQALGDDHNRRTRLRRKRRHARRWRMLHSWPHRPHHRPVRRLRQDWQPHRPRPHRPQHRRQPGSVRQPRHRPLCLPLQRPQRHSPPHGDKTVRLTKSHQPPQLGAWRNRGSPWRDETEAQLASHTAPRRRRCPSMEAVPGHLLWVVLDDLTRLCSDG
jgi:hypothetical protein